jgi:hypothetical protein
MVGENMKRFLSVMLFLAVVIGVGFCASNSDAAAWRKLATANATTKPGDCAACHKNAKVLPGQHVATKSMSYKDCQACHTQGSESPGSLYGKIPGHHIHALSGVQCSQCHGNTKHYAPVAMNKCLSCHGDTKELAKKTADVKPHNPHESRHYGTEADCNLCHHQHEKSVNHCGECHPFRFVVP